MAKRCLEAGRNLLEIERGSLKSTGCRALPFMQHPASKLKELRLPSCQLDNEGLGLCVMR